MATTLTAHLVIDSKAIPAFNLCIWENSDFIERWFTKNFESDITHLWFDSTLVLKLYQLLKRVDAEPNLQPRLLPGSGFCAEENLQNMETLRKFFNTTQHYTKIKINFSYSSY
jgi:hypothetical protein